MKCPCKGCTERRLTCHGFCERYQTWKKELDETNEWLRNQKSPRADAVAKGWYQKIKTGKSQKWNLKTRHGGDGKW